MSIEEVKQPVNAGESAPVLSRRFSVAPMMDWTDMPAMPNVYGNSDALACGM
ncbi:hypothetical protein [Pseudomonas syringae]|uniref:hypothetical protein n=1 Tax=Pseudomonas syringae TaxID=317 RepID=UPI0015E1AAC9|nr:hypothetical protein [Pseudomonas syringae]